MITREEKQYEDGERQKLPRVTIDRSYEVPSVAGYSYSGNKLYIDKRLPRSFKTRDGKSVDIDYFVSFHEVVEKALMDRLGLSYEHAHAIATRAERAEVESEGVSWAEYDAWFRNEIKKIEGTAAGHEPPDLDKSPERAPSKPFKGLAKITERDEP